MIDLARILHEFRCDLPDYLKITMIYKRIQVHNEIQIVPLPVCRLIARHIPADPA
jgi:hypothetical protein